MVIAHGFLTLLKRLVSIRLCELPALLSGFPRAQGRLPQVSCINQNQHSQLLNCTCAAGARLTSSRRPARCGLARPAAR